MGGGGWGQRTIDRTREKGNTNWELKLGEKWKGKSRETEVDVLIVSMSQSEPFMIYPRPTALTDPELICIGVYACV